MQDPRSKPTDSTPIRRRLGRVHIQRVVAVVARVGGSEEKNGRLLTADDALQDEAAENERLFNDHA
jgi:hypothetical protein